MSGARAFAPLPRSRRRYGFSLVALADVLFQLLIFFMLSSDLSPYALLPLRAGDSPVQGSGSGAVGAAAPAIVWTVAGDAIVVNGQRFGLSDIPALARALPVGPRLLLQPQDGTQVQHMVNVIEKLSEAGIMQVEVAR